MGGRMNPTDNSFDPWGVLQQTQSQASSNFNTTLLFGVGILLVIGWLFYRGGR